jgi:hypothetical protein
MFSQPGNANNVGRSCPCPPGQSPLATMSRRFNTADAIQNWPPAAVEPGCGAIPCYPCGPDGRNPVMPTASLGKAK